MNEFHCPECGGAMQAGPWGLDMQKLCTECGYEITKREYKQEQALLNFLDA